VVGKLNLLVGVFKPVPEPSPKAPDFPDVLEPIIVDELELRVGTFEPMSSLDPEAPDPMVELEWRVVAKLTPDLVPKLPDVVGEDKPRLG
jgi:hypothetical protein